MPEYNQAYLDEVSKRITQSLIEEFPEEDFSEEKTREKLKTTIKQFSELK